MHENLQFDHFLNKTNNVSGITEPTDSSVDVSFSPARQVFSRLTPTFTIPIG